MKIPHLHRAFSWSAVAIVALLLGGAALNPAGAQSASKAKSSAEAANTSKAAAKAAAEKAAAEKAAADVAKKEAAEAAAKAAAVAAKAEADRKAAEALAAKQQQEAAELAARAAAAEQAAKAAADEELRKQAASEAAALKLAAERAEAEKLAAAAAAEARAQKELEAKNNATTSQGLAEKANTEALTANSKAQESANEAAGADVAAQKAAEKAVAAEAAEQKYYSSTSDEERRRALEELESNNSGAEQDAFSASGHAKKGDDAYVAASGARGRARKAVDDMPPLLPGLGAPIQSRSWLLCGGGYTGWAENLGGPAGAPGLCAQVVIDVAQTSQVGRLTIVMKVRNLSGLFNSYMGSVLTAIGLDNVWMNANGTEHAINPSQISVTGTCIPGDQNCANSWSLATGSHSKMPNGIGRVDLKFDNSGLPGGIASTCKAAPNDPSWQSPSNPNGLYVTDCNDVASWVTFQITTDAPIDLTYAQVSLRAQNGYLGGSTACIYTGEEGAGNLCQPTTTVPEPGTIVLTATGIAGLLAARRRKKQALDS